MEKQKTRVHTSIDKDTEKEFYTYKDSLIDDVINYFLEAKNQGATHVEWYAHGEDECTAEPYSVKEETDEEFKARLEAIEQNKRDHAATEEINEREIYEQLKKKYG